MNKNIINQLRNMALYSSAWETQYKTAKLSKQFEKSNTTFLPIRHFNSDSPIIPGDRNSVPYNISLPINDKFSSTHYSTSTLIGGGYFLWHKNKYDEGKGIAIDPGYGFIDTLYRYHGFGVKHIDAIIITHDHLDHHADLETILSLRRGEKGILEIFTTESVAKSYALQERSQIKKINMELKIIKTFPDPNDIPDQIVDGVQALFLPALHWQRVRQVLDERGTPLGPQELLKSHLQAFGVQLIIEDSNKRILITGDTLFPIKTGDEYLSYGHSDKKIPHLKPNNSLKLGWVPSDLYEHREECKNLISTWSKKVIEFYKTLKKSEIVCLHLGSIKELKNIDIKSTVLNSNLKTLINDEELSYDGFHLGFFGCVRVIDLLVENDAFDIEDGLIIVSEFGEELTGNRQNICVMMKGVLSELLSVNLNEISILPSEIDLRVFFNNEDSKAAPDLRGIFCSYCKKVHDWKNTVAQEGPGEIITYVSNRAKESINPNCSCEAIF